MIRSIQISSRKDSNKEITTEIEIKKIYLIHIFR